jgi:hypothetical protein
MEDRIDALLQALEELSPMPADDSPLMTVERLREYNELTQQIHKIAYRAEAGRDTRLMELLIRSFGYGDAHGSYWTVVHTLEKYPAGILRQALRQAVHMGDPGARLWSAHMLGRQRNSEDIPVLIAALEDSEYEVRRNALEALAMIGDMAAKPAMELLLSDPVEEVRKLARECIDALFDQRWVVEQ